MRLSIFITTLALTASLSAQDFLHFDGKAGPGKGKRVVLLAGDEEYRSEEAMPMLGKILSQRHGFDCDVLFSADADGTIQVGKGELLSHPESLDKADVIVMSLRFRHWPDATMAKFEAAVNRGVPIVALRTSTHAFNLGKESAFAKWTHNSKEWAGGFGRQVLGETWVAHHGAHKKEGARGIVEDAQKAHPVLRGVSDVFGDSDVYTANPLPDVTVLMRGQVTETLDPKSAPVAGKKNEPMQPMVWTRTHKNESGKTNNILTTTMGAASDLKNEGLRRLVVNGVFWGLGMDVPAKADVNFVDPWMPSFYGFGTQRAGLKVADLGLGKALGEPAAPEKKEEKKPEEKKDDRPHAPKTEPAPAASVRPQKVAPPAQGERIVFLGNGLAERDVYYSRLESELHLRYPAQQLFVRNMGRPGDTPAFRPHPARVSQWAFPGAEKFHPELNVHHGKGFFPTPDQWLTHLKADTIVAFFGYNESFDGAERAANFEAELDAWVLHTLSKAYNGTAAPRLVLASPIAYEDQSAKRDLPKGFAENANLALYAAVMESVAKKRGLTFIDFFNPTKALYAKAQQPFTTGGFVPTDEGYQQLAEILATGMFGHQSRISQAEPEKVHAAVKQKDWFWNNDYNILNGVHTHGQRYNPFGPQNYPDEVKKTREMAALRDGLIHAVASGKTTSLAVDDSKTHPLPPVPSNYQPSKKNGTEIYLYGEDAVKTLTVPEGYKVELFASEKEFPNLANPMQISFDDKGRLWVAAMPTYPHYRPGDAMPNDKLLIYEDTNGDGKADKETVFADHLHLPIGFEFAPEGVYLSQEPNLVLLRDTNGDDKADSREIVLGGFDTHDTHHAISAYTADPSGAFILAEGVFLHSNIETPYGPVRCVDGGFFRYSPQRGHLERTAQLSIPNPWGVVFDKWGQDFFLHTSGTTMNWMMPSEVKPTFGAKTPLTRDLIPEGQKVRPTSGLEVVSSRHFPDEVQGDLVLCNAIGFLGIKQHKIEDDGTGYKTAFRHDLLKSSDGNFRPVDLEFAPDGSLYVIDWHNVLIGHMQHNARDPLRDHVHGRIYRISYPARPLIKPPKVDGAPIAALLENLKEPELRLRYRSRRELRSHPASEVLPAVKTWVASLKKDDANYEHHVLEALWTTWGLNQADDTLLRQMLQANDLRARAAAVRVLRYNSHRIADHVALFEKAANDPHGRVRLEAIVAASWLPNIAAAKNIVAIAAKQPLDEWSKNAAKTAADRLGGIAETIKPEIPIVPPPAHLSGDAKKQFLAGQEVYFREGHCATCHQANGAGLDPAFPSIQNSPWVTDDHERLIKLVMYGLMGPIEINGKKYDGQVPMTPFGGMLKDDEVAAVLTFVRNHFGNKADAITADQVKAIRAANAGRVNFYTTEELLKQHPLKN